MWVFLVLSILLILLIGLGGIALSKLSPKWGDEIEARLQRIRDAGFPASQEELTALQLQIPSEQNGAALLERALLRLKPPEVNTADWPIESNRGLSIPLAPEVGAEIIKHIEANWEALDTFLAAHRFERAQFDIPTAWDLPPGFLLSTREGAKTLCLNALIRMSQGSAEEAVQSLETAFLLARGVQEIPTMATYMIGGALLSLNCSTIEALLSFDGVSNEHLSRLQHQIELSQNPAGMARAIAADRVMGIHYIEPLRTMQATRTQSKVLLDQLQALLTGAFFRETEYIAYLDYMEESISGAALLPLQARVEKGNQLAARANELSERRSVISFVVAPHSRAIKTDSELQAKLVLTRAALALERHRGRDGTLPGSLRELAPEFLPSLPADPFTGAIIDYRVTPSGYTLVCAGDQKEIRFEVGR
jgi:hypothetical protein